MERRAFLAFSGLTLLSTTAGCVGNDNSTDGADPSPADNPDNTTDNPTNNSERVPSGDPAEIIEEWHRSLDDGDIDTVNGLIHEDASEETGVEKITEGQGQFYEGNSVSLDSTTVVEEDDEIAIIEVTATVAGNTETSRWELRAQGSEWKVYGIEDE